MDLGQNGNVRNMAHMNIVTNKVANIRFSEKRMEFFCLFFCNDSQAKIFNFHDEHFQVETVFRKL